MKELRISYDKKTDVFYITFEKIKKTIGKEIANEVVQRIDPKTGKIVGYTILRFSKKEKVEMPINFAL